MFRKIYNVYVFFVQVVVVKNLFGGYRRYVCENVCSKKNFIEENKLVKIIY